MSSDLADTYNSVILSVAKNLKVSKRFQSRTDLETLHVVQGDTIIAISKLSNKGRLPQNCIDPLGYQYRQQMQFFAMTGLYIHRHPEEVQPRGC